MKEKKIVFLTNYYNHHQSEVAKEFYALTDGDFLFVETEEMSDERKKLGYGDWDKPQYVCTYDEKVQKYIDMAEVVIYGSAPYSYIKKRLKKGKMTFIYSERLFKKDVGKLGMFLRKVKNYLNFGRYKNSYLLCASAYASYDYSRVLAFKNRSYKWGYFPKLSDYEDVDGLIKDKKEGSLLWVGRLIDWKRACDAINVVKRLKENGYNVTLNIIGSGALENEIRAQIEKENLGDYIKMLGSMKPQQVRVYMEESQIYLFTSNFNEGWGAVLNESMSSACAIVASHAIGSAPYLIENGINGYIYQNQNEQDLYNKVKSLLDDGEKTREFGKKAYLTMKNLWNAKVCAKRFIELCKVLKSQKQANLFESGPCSKAEILKNDWYK